MNSGFSEFARFVHLTTYEVRCRGHPPSLPAFLHHLKLQKHPNKLFSGVPWLFWMFFRQIEIFDF